MANEQNYLFLYMPWTDNNEDGLGGLLIEYIIAPNQESAVRKFVSMIYENEEIRIFLFNYINTPTVRLNRNLRRAFTGLDMEDVDMIQKVIMENIDSIVDVLTDAEDDYFSIKELPSPMYAMSLVKSARHRVF